MNTKENLKTIKKEAFKKVQCAIELRVNELKKSDSFKELNKQIETFESDPYLKTCDFYFDESGFLNSSITMDFSDFEGEDSEVIEALQVELCEFGYFEHDYKTDWKFSQCLGEPTICNFEPYEGCYAIYSQELRLTIAKVINEKHGFALIEQAMRKAGVFENIVSTDYYGHFVRFLTTGLGSVSDVELQKIIDDLEEGEDDE